MSWDGTDARGHAMPSGVYFVRARVGRELLDQKIVLLSETSRRRGSRLALAWDRWPAPGAGARPPRRPW